MSRRYTDSRKGNPNAGGLRQSPRFYRVNTEALNFDRTRRIPNNRSRSRGEALNEIRKHHQFVRLRVTPLPCKMVRDDKNAVPARFGLEVVFRELVSQRARRRPDAPASRSRDVLRIHGNDVKRSRDGDSRYLCIHRLRKGDSGRERRPKCRSGDRSL